MRILFDQGTPVPLRRFFPDHQVSTAYAEGWSNFQNGDLLAAAEGRFDLFITTDKNLRYQQDLRGRTLAILVLRGQRRGWRGKSETRIIMSNVDVGPHANRELSLTFRV